MAETIHRELGEFIQNELMGCTFVGISNDGEVFVSFDHEDLDLESAAKTKIKDKFANRIGSITTVVQTSIEQLKQLVDQLNQALDEEDKQGSQLLDIGKF